jgi:hypothetical protein
MIVSWPWNRSKIIVKSYIKIIQEQILAQDLVQLNMILYLYKIV